jgi:hypothetical protein
MIVHLDNRKPSLHPSANKHLITASAPDILFVFILFLSYDFQPLQKDGEKTNGSVL